MAAKVKCNYDCFNCIFDDCVVNTITPTERAEQDKRDRNYTSYGTILKQKPVRMKHRHISREVVL